MSRRGAGAASEKPSHEFVKAPEAVADRAVQFAGSLLKKHKMEPDEASVLLVQTAIYVAQLPGGFSRDEWLELCAGFWDELAFEADKIVTAPGGDA